MGHSLGAAFAEAYAGWRFEDGTKGFDDLAGIVLLEGLLGFTLGPIQETEFHAGFKLDGSAVPGLEAIRGGQTFPNVPLVGTKLFPLVEVQSMRAAKHPKAVSEDPVRNQVMSLLLLLTGTPPRMTDRAALGFMLDGDHSISGVYSMGHGIGGAFESVTLPGGGTISHPSDPDATYDWLDALDTTPPEWTPVASFAAQSVGPTNPYEWYTPFRLLLDLCAAAPGALPTDGWQAAAGLRVFDSALVDLPVLAVSASGYATSDYEAVRKRLAPTIGPGRPHEGATRGEEAAFKAIHVDMLHADVVSAADREGNPVPAAVLDFAVSNAAPGTVSIPAP
jgi:hypothetical protein